MPVKIKLAGIALSASLGIILGMGSGCASSRPRPRFPRPSRRGLAIKQDPMTSYMQSQVGTPNELSPLAPAEATNIKKVAAAGPATCTGRP